MVPFYSDYLPARPTIDVLDECKLINVRQTPFDNLLNAAVKRGLDIIGSLILIILTSLSCWSRPSASSCPAPGRSSSGRSASA